MTSGSRIASAILAAAILLGLGLRLWGISQLEGYSHDGVISYLAATGNQGRWSDRQQRMAPPFAQWTSAAEWRDELLTIHGDASLRQIAMDLTYHDTHPPLYFWLLHYAVAIVGVHPWTGPLLDLPFCLATILSMYGLGAAAGLPRERAALVALVWSVSIGAVSLTWDARQYGLLTLLTVLFAWALLRTLEELEGARPLRLLALAAITAAGMLTHYYFAAVVFCAALAVLIVRAAPDWRRLGLIALSLLAGAAGMAAAHPGFWRSLMAGEDLAQRLGRDELVHRLYVLAWTTGQFVTVSRRFAAAGVALTVATIIIALVISGTARRWLAGAWREAGAPLRVILSTGGLLVVVTWLFLFRLAPPTANAARYLAPAWPFVAFGAVYFLGQGDARVRSRLSLGLAVLLTAMTSLAVMRHHGGPFKPMLSGDMLASAERIVIDTPLRGSVLRVLLHAPPDALLFVADQQRLIERPDEWLPQLRPGDLLTSHLATGNTLTARGRLEELLSSRYEYRLAAEGPDDYIAVYEVIANADDRHYTSTDDPSGLSVQR